MQLGEFCLVPLGARVVKTFYSYICIVWSQYQIGHFGHDPSVVLKDTRDLLLHSHKVKGLVKDRL